MIRRSIRVFCLFGLAVLVGTAAVAQFFRFSLLTPHGHIFLDPTGVAFQYPPNAVEWSAGCFHLESWSFDDLLETPSLDDGNGLRLDLPWWLLVASWGVLTAVVWRSTRMRPKVGRAFPIEPTAKAK